jgi:phasin family protein
MKTVQDFVSFNQANFEAFTSASRILATGLQDLSKQAYAASQAQIAGSLAHLKSLSGVTSVERVVELQTKAVRSTVESSLAETGRLAEAAIKLAEDVAAPITTRADVALQVFSRAA